MNFKNTLANLKNLGPVKKGPTTKHPQRDWLVLVGVTLALFFAVALWSLITFQLQISEAEKETDPQRVPELKTSSVDTVQAIFEKRAGLRADYQSGKKFIDPSK